MTIALTPAQDGLIEALCELARNASAEDQGMLALALEEYVRAHRSTVAPRNMLGALVSTLYCDSLDRALAPAGL